MYVINKIKNFFSNNIDKLSVLLTVLFHADKSILSFIIIILMLYIFYKNNSYSFVNKDLSKIFKEEEDEIIDSFVSPTTFDNSNSIIPDHDIHEVVELNNNDKNIDIEVKKIKKSNNPYDNDCKKLHDNYNKECETKDFKLHVNHGILTTPIFNLRTFKDLDFYYNFYAVGLDVNHWNNLIMVNDLHKWMNTSSLSNEDLEDKFIPVLFIEKKNDSELIKISEYLKIFVKTDNHGIKTAFCQKGNEYQSIKKHINVLIEKHLIENLLEDDEYYVYNLSEHNSLSKFLENLLSLILIPKNLLGEEISIDISHHCENLKTYEYFFNSISGECNLFQTSI